MKRIFFAAVLMVGSYAASAQISKGQWLVGGNASFKSEKFGSSDNNKVTTFEFKPDVGYFFLDNLAAGIRFNYSSSKVKSEDKANTYLLAGPFVRYYFLPAVQKVNIFVDGTYGFGKEGQDPKINLNGYEFTAGPAIFLSPNVALELGISYQSLKYKDISDRDNTFGVNVGFQIHLGKAKK
jgi:hypothetical protein